MFRPDLRACILGGLAGMVLVMTGALSASPATVSISPNATLQSGQSRIIAAAWGDASPYNVNFQCNTPGCADFVNSSTHLTSLSRTVTRTTCSGSVVSNHTITVRESTGGTANGSSRTTWNPGGPCR